VIYIYTPHLSTLCIEQGIHVLRDIHDILYPLKYRTFLPLTFSPFPLFQRLACGRGRSSVTQNNTNPSNNPNNARNKEEVPHQATANVVFFQITARLSGISLASLPQRLVRSMVRFPVPVQRVVGTCVRVIRLRPRC
jgi:hypothetical protein